MTPTSEILIVRDRIREEDLARLVAAVFGDMVKFVVDLERRVAAVGGELHSDAGARERIRVLTHVLIGRGETLT